MNLKLYNINKVNREFFFFIKFIITIALIIPNTNKFINLNFIHSYILSKIEFIKYEKFLNICENKFKRLIKFKKVNNPEISIISPVFNRERYILRFLLSIQYQNFKNIEIIFIDDSSRDYSAKLINKFKNIDKRIKLLKNFINQGTFKSRNIGIIYSKGQYAIFPDPDDILSENILSLCYKYAKKYKYEVIRFNIYDVNKKKIIFNKIINKLENRPIFQPELSTYIYYGNNNELEIIDYYIHNKLIKRETFIKALNILKIFYLNIYMTFMEDSMINYIIYKITESFFFLKKIGYYYLRNSVSMTKNLNKINVLIFKFFFIYLKLIFEYSKNSKYQKDMANKHFNIINKAFIKKVTKINNYYNFFNNVINMYLNCSFITEENKHILKNIKKKIKKIN